MFSLRRDSGSLQEKEVLFRLSRKEIALMALDSEPARPLSSREIAKIVSGILGTLAEFCEPSDICDAMAHFHDHAQTYEKAWREIHRHRAMLMERVARGMTDGT